jgi:PAS domain S-box-containing protein/diguanylate cyclase (GGDEF)-like protein
MNGVGESAVTERTELLEAALDGLAEGMALADLNGEVAAWNRAAETITGYAAGEIIGHGVRRLLDAMVEGGSQNWIRKSESAAERGFLVHLRHKVGHQLPVMTRILVLRDALGGRIGTGVVFHPAQTIDALPHQELNEDSYAGRSRIELEERLAGMHDDFVRGESTFGVLWITVDQAPGLRRSHGLRACEAMLEKVERTLASGLKAAEEIGRWGDDDFLVISHERSAAALTAHAQMLAGLTRTTDFRWWGDRVSLTVSIGAAQAERGECLSQLLERAEGTVVASVHAGGNQVTAARGKE